MNYTEFNQFLDQCYAELEKKHFYLKAEFGIGYYEKSEIDWQRGILKFTDNSAVKLIAKVTPIGSYSTTNSTWMWGWEYPSIPAALKQKCEQLKELGKIARPEIFAASIFTAESETAWEIAAMACHHFKSMGCYRAVVRGVWVFATIDDVQSPVDYP